MRKGVLIGLTALALAVPATAVAQTSHAVVAPGKVVTIHDCYVQRSAATIRTGSGQTLHGAVTTGPAGWRVDVSRQSRWSGRYGSSVPANLFEFANTGAGTLQLWWSCQ